MWSMMCCGLRFPANARQKKVNTRLWTVVVLLTTCLRFLCVVVQYTLFNILLILLSSKSSMFSYETFRKVYSTWEQAPNDIILSLFSFWQIKFGCTALTAAFVWGTYAFIKSGCECLFAAPVDIVPEHVDIEFKRDFSVVEKIFSYKQHVGFLA